MISESVVLVLLATSHGIVPSYCHLVARLALLTSAAGVVVSDVKAMGPAIVHVLEVLGCGVCGPKLSFLLIDLLTVGSSVTGKGCLVVGEVPRLLSKKLERCCLGFHLVHESLVSGGEVGKHGPISGRGRCQIR